MFYNKYSMKTIFKLILFSIPVFIISFFIFSNFAFANTKEEVFEAKILEIIKEEDIKREDGVKVFIQELKIKGIGKRYQDREAVVENRVDENAVNRKIYKKGERVLVSYARTEDGKGEYLILDHIRRSNLYFLAILFVLAVIWIGKWKGVRALIGLVLSFSVIMYFIIPQILAGKNPLLIGIIGALAILAFIIYITWGFTRKAHIALISVFFSLVICGLLSVFFTYTAKISGTAAEETMFLVNLVSGKINFQGLLLAGIIIGALGVLDDIVISQVSAVAEIKKANPRLSTSQIYKSAQKIGIDHIYSMTNTLFLAYVGVALPLLILFVIKEPPFQTFNQIINNEIIATEIVRALVGSIGIVLAVPISTFIAAKYLKVEKPESK